MTQMIRICHNVGDPGLISGLGGSPGGGNGNPLQYSCLENPHGQRSLEGYSSLGCKEADTTEQLTLHTSTLPLLKHILQQLPKKGFIMESKPFTCSRMSLFCLLPSHLTEFYKAILPPFFSFFKTCYAIVL